MNSDEQQKITAEEFRQKFIHTQNEIARLRQELKRLRPVSVQEANEALHELFPDLPKDWILVKKRVFKRKPRKTNPNAGYGA